MKKLICSLVFAAAICRADGAADEAGRQEEQRACTGCHSLRLIHSQRLSPAAWKKELTKMTGWGASISNEQALLDYLSHEYSDAKPVPNPVLSKTSGSTGSAKSDQ
jgi:hypothetical protein